MPIVYGYVFLTLAHISLVTTSCNFSTDSICGSVIITTAVNVNRSLRVDTLLIVVNTELIDVPLINVTNGAFFFPFCVFFDYVIRFCALMM